jgi:hypothetical protein
VGHQVPEACSAGCGEVVPGVPEIVKVQASGANRFDGVRSGGRLVEVVPRPRGGADARLIGPGRP